MRNRHLQAILPFNFFELHIINRSKVLIFHAKYFWNHSPLKVIALFCKLAWIKINMSLHSQNFKWAWNKWVCLWLPDFSEKPNIFTLIFFMSIKPKEWNSTIFIYLEGMIECRQLLILWNIVDSFFDIFPFLIQLIIFNFRFLCFHNYIFYFLLLYFWSFRFWSRWMNCFSLCKKIGNWYRNIYFFCNHWNRIYRFYLNYRSLRSFNIVKRGIIIICVKCKNFSLIIKHISRCIDFLQIFIILHIKFSSQLSQNIFLLLLGNHFYFFWVFCFLNNDRTLWFNKFGDLKIILEKQKNLLNFRKCFFFIF